MLASLLEWNIPVMFFMGIYALFLLFYIAYGFFNLVHLLEYGRVGLPLFAIVIAFVGGSLLLISGSVLWLFQYDLTYAIPLGDVETWFRESFLTSPSF